MNDDRHSQSNNPYRPKVLQTHDRLHDAQLLRDVAIINAQTISELGALPPGGFPATLKRRPYLPHRTTSVALMTMAVHHPKDEPMNLHQIAAATMLPLAVAACSSHGDPWHPTKNPHPVKRYEVIATTDAPGPWDSVKGYVFFDVINTACVPQDSFTGSQNVPNVDYDFEMTRVNRNTWKGYFYRDALQDEDYFGQGVCHWDVTGVTPSFTVHDEHFGAATWFEDALQKGPQIDYFKKSQYLDQSLTNIGALDFSSINPEYARNPYVFFPITVTIKEVAP